MKTLQSRVGPNLLQKVTRLFDSSPRTIFGELIQNARRAGATLIDVRTRQADDGRTRVTFTDNGRGIPDMLNLLVLSESDWDDQLKEDEDPAGMGLYSLCNLTGVTTVRSGDQFVNLSTEVFTGRQTAKVWTTYRGNLMGTRISFWLPKNSYPESAFETAVRWAGIRQAMLNGEPRPSTALVTDGVVDNHLGVRLDSETTTGWSDPRVRFNFHGIQVSRRADSQVLRDLMTAVKHDVLVEVLHCRELKMVLPARNAMITNGALADLEKLVTRMLFKTVASWPEHKLSRYLWREAEKLGIILPQVNLNAALKCLGGASDSRPWAIAEDTHEGLRIQDYADQFSTYRLALPKCILSGYPEYDALPRLTMKLTVDGQAIGMLSDIMERGGAMEADSLTLTLMDEEEDSEKETIHPDFVVITEDGEYPSSCFGNPYFGLVRRRGYSDLKAICTWMVDHLYRPSDNYADKEEESDEFSSAAYDWLLANCIGLSAAFEAEVLSHLRWPIESRFAELVGRGLEIRVEHGPNGPEFKFTYDHAASNS